MRRKKAFTLIELLVVVAIIAVLVAMLLPAIQKARDAGKRAVCGSNIHQIMLAFHYYADSNKDGFTLADGQTTDGGTINHDNYLDLWPQNSPMNSGRYYGYWPLMDAQYGWFSNVPKNFKIYDFKGYLQGKHFYCPADSLKFETNFPTYPWNYGNVSYSYRGVSNPPPLPRFTTVNWGGANKISDVIKPMVMDWFCTFTPAHGSIYNVGLSDGSIRTVTENECFTSTFSSNWWTRSQVWSLVDARTGFTGAP